MAVRPVSIDTNGWDLVCAMRFPQVNADLQARFDGEVRQKETLRQQIPVPT